MNLSTALSYLASVERSIQEHHIDINVDIKVLAGEEYVLMLSDGYYLWCQKDWERYARNKGYLFKRKSHNGKQ